MATTNYLLTLCSRNSNVITNTDNVQVTFNVNWTNLLPLNKYSNYKCTFQFVSEELDNTIQGNATIVSPAQIHFSTGRKNISDGLSNTQYIGVIHPIVLNSEISYYSSSASDNHPFTIFPSNENNLTVRLTSFTGANLAESPHWVLSLNFEPIIEQLKI